MKRTHPGRFAICETSFTSHPSICSVTPNGCSRNSSWCTISMPTSSAVSLEGVSVYRVYVSVKSLNISSVCDKERSKANVSFRSRAYRTHLPACFARNNISSFKNWIRDFVLLVSSLFCATWSAWGQSVRTVSLCHSGKPGLFESSNSSDPLEVDAIQVSISDFPIPRYSQMKERYKRPQSESSNLELVSSRFRDKID